MAKLIYSALASADGYVEDAAGSFHWAAPDEELHRPRAAGRHLPVRPYSGHTSVASFARYAPVSRELAAGRLSEGPHDAGRSAGRQALSQPRSNGLLSWPASSLASSAAQRTAYGAGAGRRLPLIRRPGRCCPGRRAAAASTAGSLASAGSGCGCGRCHRLRSSSSPSSGRLAASS
jgi:hypothetical protein